MLFLPQSASSLSSPMSVILLRVLALLICAFLVAASFYKLPDEVTSPSGTDTLSGDVTPSKPKLANESSPNNKSGEGVPVLQSLVDLLPDQVLEHTKLVWQHGRDSQLTVVSVGLLTCLTAIFLAGPARYACTTFLFPFFKHHLLIKIRAKTICCGSCLVVFPG